MQINLFTLAQMLPAVLMLCGIYIMLSAMLREDIERFRKSLYVYFTASIISGFIYMLKISQHGEESLLDLPLITVTAILGVVAIGSICYQYVHRVLPEVFVKATSLFSLITMLVLGANLIPTRWLQPTNSNPDADRFVESSLYKQRRQRADATFASDTRPKQANKN